MSNGGYKGASPARETSPEQYPGVWELTEQFQAQADGNWPFQAADCAPKSLRFDGSSSYLAKTFGQAGNTRCWTYSVWVKRSKLGATNTLLMAYDQTGISEPQYATITLEYTDRLRVGWAYDAYKYCNAVHRDPGAWMHICVAVNTYHSTPSERVQVSINGVKQTSFSTTHDPDLGQELAYNRAYLHHIGAESGQMYAGLFVSELNFIDGQQLSCDEFGFYDGQGLWMPKRFTGDYSSGPDWNNFISGTQYSTGRSLDMTFDGLDNTYSAAAAGETITFAPVPAITGLTKVKLRVYKDSAATTDIKLNGNVITSSFNAGQYTDAEFAVNNLTELTWTTNSSSMWIGVSQIFVERGGVYELLTPPAVGRNSFHLDFSDGVKDQSGLGNDWNALNLNLGGDFTYSSAHGSNVTTAEFAKMVDSDLNTYGEASGDFIGFAFAGEKITFKIENTSSNAKLFYVQPATNTSFNFVNGGTWSVSGGSASGNQWTLNANSTETGTFTVPSNYVGTGRIYFSGNNTHFRVYDISPASDTESTKDISVDSPVNGNEASTGAGGERRGNYATINPLSTSSTLANGNLQLTTNSGLHYSTIGVSSGKWYAEWTATSTGGSQMVGISKGFAGGSYLGSDSDGFGYYGANGQKYNTSGVNYGATYGSGDIIGVALNLDDGNIVFYKNGTSQGTAFTGLPSGTYFFAGGESGMTGYWNFGQRPFSHPVTGYSPLATSFLPEPTIKRGDEAVDVVIYDGTTSPQKVTGTRFASDLIWIKSRTHTGWHILQDSVRGFGKTLFSNSTNMEVGNANDLISDVSETGFSVNTNYNGSTDTATTTTSGSNSYCAWVWDAGESTTTIAAGSLNSSAYNQSQTWSSSTFFNANSNNFYAGSAASIFDNVESGPGSTGDFALPVDGGTFTLTFSQFGSATTVELQVEGTGNALKINGSFVTIPSGSPATATYSVSGLTTIEWLYNGASNYCYLGSIKVDGVKLVDNGISVTNVPSIATTVRARPETGFSIAKYTGTSANATIAHGLSNAAPEFIIVKMRSSSGYDWCVYHKDLTSAAYSVSLHSTAAEASEPTTWNSTAPTKSAISLGTRGSVNNNGSDFIAYSWTSIEGYSSIGSFQNPSSTDGAFVFCGFKPALIIAKCVKNISSSAGHGDWIIKDSTRSPFNNPSDGNTIALNVDNAEDNYYSASQAAIDILSNGFKIRHPNSAPLGDPGRLYIYAAWAENPFASQSRAV